MMTLGNSGRQHSTVPFHEVRRPNALIRTGLIIFAGTPELNSRGLVSSSSLERMNHPREVIGAALAHGAKNQTEAAYCTLGPVRAPSAPDGAAGRIPAAETSPAIRFDSRVRGLTTCPRLRTIWRGNGTLQ